MSDRDTERAALFMTKLTFQVLIYLVLGLFILTYYYPKVMLPLIACAAIVLLLLNFR